MAINFDYDPKWKPAGGASDAGPDFDYDPAWKPTAPAPVSGGLVASAKQAIGSTIKGAGQLAADFIPGVGQDNAATRYGKSVVDANPTRVTDFDSLKDNPLTAVTEATGNAAGSMGAMLGARALGQGITAVSPLAGPAAPLVAGLGQAVSWAGPAAVAALPSFGGIREKQIQKDPNAADSTADKLKAAIGAGAVGAIESRFGPQEWAIKAMTKEGRNALAEKFAANSLAGSVAKGAAKGAAIEGAEELAQNPTEQVAAGDNPLTAESLKETAFGGVMGALGGGVLGGAGGAGFRKRPEAAAQPAATPANPTAAPSNPLATPGESIALQQQILDEQEQLAASINPSDGPLSSAASLAVQTGAAKTPTQLAVEQERQRAAELAAQQDDAESEIYNSTGIEDQADNLDWMRLLSGEQADLADLRDKAQFEAKQRQSRQAGELRDAKDQMLAEGVYEADQRRAQQQAQQAANPGLPFERIAPEDYDTLNPVKLGEGEIVRDEPRQLPPPRQQDALPSGNRAAPALGFTPKAPDPMQATEDGLVGTARQFDELRAMKRERKDQMRRASELAQSLVRQGATLQGKSLVAPSGRVLAPQLTLPQYRAVSDALKQNQTNAQQNATQAAPAQAQQAETQGQEQPAAVKQSPAAELQPTNSLGKTASWVVRNKETKEVLFETYDQNKVDALNSDKYEAVPILAYLQSINGKEPVNGTARPPAGIVSGGSDSQGSVDARSVVDNRADRGSGYERKGEGDATAEPAPRVPGAGTGGKRAKPTNLLKIVRDAGGVSAARKNDVAQDSRAVGVFRSGGMELDSLAELLHQNGFLTDADVSDSTSGAEKAVELLREAIAGNRPLNMADSERAMSDAQEAEHKESIRKRADELGVKWRFRKIEDVEKDVADAEARADLDEDSSAYDIESVSGSVQDVLDEFDTFYESTPLRGEAAMRAMGFTEEEIREAIQSQDAERQDRGTQPRGQEAGREADRSQDREQAEVLESYTEQDLAARDESQRLAAETRAKQEKAADDKARADAERDSFTLTGSDRPADVMAAMGQGGLFDPLVENARQVRRNSPKETRNDLIARLEAAEVFSEEQSYLIDRLYEVTLSEASSMLDRGEMPVFDTGRNTFVTISPSNQQPGKTQLTRYNNHGVSGDTQYDSVEAAIRGERLFDDRILPSSEAETRFAESLKAEAEYQSKVAQQRFGLDAPVTAKQSAPSSENLKSQPSTLEGLRRDPTKVSMFNPYQVGDVVTIGGQDWQVNQDMPGWYLTSTGNWRGTHPNIQRIRGMADLIREIEQSYQDALTATPKQSKPNTTKTEERLSPLAPLFSDLDSTSTRKANKASRAAQSHPKAAEIDYVQKNFHDVLLRLMEEGKLTVNGVSSVSEENSKCL